MWEGLAWAFPKYSVRYVQLETQARLAGRGVFASENTTPWDFRAKRWTEAEKKCLSQLRHKG